MFVNYKMVVDFARPNKSNTVLVAEDDANSRNCLFTLLFDKAPFDMTGVVTAEVRAIKPSGAIVIDTATIKMDEDEHLINELEYLLPSSLTDETGTVTLTITLADNLGARITSFEFYIKIRNALYNEDDYIDDDDMAGFRDLLNRTRAALARMEVMVQQDALPNPYPIRITVDEVEYEYTGESLVEILMGEVAYLGAESGEVEVTEDDSAAAVAVAAAEEAEGYKEDCEGVLADVTELVNNFDSLIPTANVAKDVEHHQTTITITDRYGVTTAVVDDGTQGITPDISMSATVDGTSSDTPTVTVTEGGTTEAPSFALAFSGLKGEKGDTGASEWGDITGDISDQTDLINTINTSQSGALSDTKSTVGWDGKNELQIPSSVVSTGIYTVNRNSDGEVTSVVANGTPTAQQNFQLVTNITLDKPKILSGCPSGGSPNDYFIYAKDANNVYYYDYGEGVILPAGTYSIIQITTRANVPMSNKEFEPMLRDASITDSTFEPYHKSVEDTISDVYGVMGENGARNRLDYKARRTSTSGTYFTQTVTDDGGLTVVGSRSEYSNLDLFNVGGANQTLGLSGNYRFYGCPEGASNSTFFMAIKDITDNNKEYFDYGDGVVIPMVANHSYSGRIYVAANQVMNHTFYPQFVLASDTYDGHTPYAMTNRELTDAVTVKETDAAMTTEKTGVTFESNYASKASGITVLNIRFSGMTADAYSVIGTIAVGYRPSRNTRFMFIHSGNFGHALVGTDGKIYTQVALNSATVTISGISWV